MSEQVIAVVVSLKLWDCTPEEAIKAFDLAVGPIVTNGGEAEVLDVTLLFPRKAGT